MLAFAREMTPFHHPSAIGTMLLQCGILGLLGPMYLYGLIYGLRSRVWGACHNLRGEE